MGQNLKQFGSTFLVWQQLSSLAWKQSTMYGEKYNPVPGNTSSATVAVLRLGDFFFRWRNWKVCWHQGQNGLSWKHASPWGEPVSVSQRYELVLLSSTHSCTNYTAKLRSYGFIVIILDTDLNPIENLCYDLNSHSQSNLPDVLCICYKEWAELAHLG